VLTRRAQPPGGGASGVRPPRGRRGGAGLAFTSSVDSGRTQRRLHYLSKKGEASGKPKLFCY